MRPHSTASHRIHEAGFTYLGLMIAVAVMGVALAGVGIVWRTSQQREREKELLYIGNEIEAGIGAYFESGGRQFPSELMDLVEDSRWPEPRHFLRRLYKDPMTNAADWTLIRNENGGITGVASRSLGVPIKKAGFRLDQEETFGEAETYANWQFIYVPRLGRRRAVPASIPGN